MVSYTLWATPRAYERAVCCVLFAQWPRRSYSRALWGTPARPLWALVTYVCSTQVSAIRLLAKRCLSLGEADAALAAEPVVSLLLAIAEADGAVPASADDPYANNRAHLCIAPPWLCGRLQCGVSRVSRAIDLRLLQRAVRDRAHRCRAGAAEARHTPDDRARDANARDCCAACALRGTLRYTAPS